MRVERLKSLIHLFSCILGIVVSTTPFCLAFTIAYTFSIMLLVNEDTYTKHDASVTLLSYCMGMLGRYIGSIFLHH